MIRQCLSELIDGRLSKSWMRAGFVLVLIALAALCASAMAQENTAEDWYKKGSEVMGRAPWEDVLKMYDKAIELSPNNATYWAAKGSAFSFFALSTNNLSYYNDSLEACNKAIQIDPENPLTWDRMGSTLFQLKRYNESLEARDRAIENIDSYQGYLPVSKREMLSSIWAGKAVTLQEAGRTDESIAAFDKSLQINPGNYEAYMMKGRALKAMGKYNESAHAYSVGSNQPPVVFKQENTSDNQPGTSRNISERNPFQEASQEYDRALQIDPGNASAWLGKAQILQILGNHNGSQGALQKALDATNETLKDNPQDANAWQARGVALAGLSRNEEAINALEKSIAILDQELQKDPEDADSWWLKAESYEALYMDDAAIQAYDKVIELNSTKTVGAWIRIADILFVKANGYNESVEAFNRAVRLMPDNATWAGGAVLDQGNSILHTDFWSDDDKILRVTIGSYNKSKKEYGFIEQIVSRPVSTWLVRGNGIDLLRMLPEYVTANCKAQENASEGWYKKGQELDRNGSYEDAIKAYDKAIQIDPRNASAWIGKGEALVNLALVENDGFDDAVKAFDKATEIDPRYAEAWFKKGDTLLFVALSKHEPDKYNEALKSLDKAIEINPKYIEAWVDKGSVLLAQQKYEDAVSVLDNATNIDPKNRGAWIAKADALANLHKYNESIEAYDKAIENIQANSTEELASIWFQKSSALLKAGRTDEALNASDKVIELNPMFAPAWYNKGTALKALGRSSEADAAFAKAKELGYHG